MEDKALPTDQDAGLTHADFPRWPGIAPLPNARMMLHVGAETVENFLVVGDAWGQLIASLLEPESAVLDIGCGCGRTARTLLHHPWITDFLGVDVVAPYIDWNSRYLRPLTDDRFRFLHLDIQTPRYNPNGRVRADDAVLPVADSSVSLAFAASLFTHLREDAARRYLAETRRALRPGGCLVASIHINPATDMNFSGDEFRADVVPDYFVALAMQAGFTSWRVIGDICGQETFVFKT
ncbi:MAG: class I SAM-dependent methyltransferase [Lysobacteraceae bacterium]